jgi:hypothetical protein
MRKSTHELETRRQEKVSKTNMGDGGKARTNWRREGKKKWARQTWVMGEKHTHPRDKKARKSEQDKHGRWGKSTHPRDKKARKSEQDKHGQWGKSTHWLETRRREKVSRTNMGNGGNAHTL